MCGEKIHQFFFSKNAQMLGRLDKEILDFKPFSQRAPALTLLARPRTHLNFYVIADAEAEA